MPVPLGDLGCGSVRIKCGCVSCEELEVGINIRVGKNYGSTLECEYEFFYSYFLSLCHDKTGWRKKGKIYILSQKRNKFCWTSNEKWERNLISMRWKSSTRIVERWMTLFKPKWYILYNTLFGSRVSIFWFRGPWCCKLYGVVLPRSTPCQMSSLCELRVIYSPEGSKIFLKSHKALMQTQIGSDGILEIK